MIVRDGILDTVLEKSRNMMIPYYLMASYLYYHEDMSMLTDERYDRLCKDMLAEWDSLQHDHKYCIDAEALKSGTAFHMPREAYPPVTVYAASALAGIEGLGYIPLDKHLQFYSARQKTKSVKRFTIIRKAKT